MENLKLKHLTIFGLMNLCLKSKAYSFEGGGKNEKKFKGISKSQTKNIKFKEYYMCLFGGDYQKECENFIIKSINHDFFFKRYLRIHYLLLMRKGVI